MSLLDRLRCALLGEHCPWRWDEESDDVLRATRELTERANREADALRAARQAGSTRSAALGDLWGSPPWKEGAGDGVG